MKKISIIVGVVIIFILIVAFSYEIRQKNPVKNTPESPTTDVASTLHDGVYIIGKDTIILKNGISELASDPKTSTRYFGNDAKGDINGDGIEDTAFLLTQQTGGTGTFYYLVALVSTSTGKVGTEAVFIGDRIAPQSTTIDTGIVTVNYADRTTNQSFADTPTIGKSLRLKLNPKTLQFGQMVADFTGEADPARMKLTMKTWNWVTTTYSNGTKVQPARTDKFKLTFKDNKSFSISTDCNGIGGEYSTNKDTIVFEKMMSTLMFCEGSQESAFSKMISDVQSYHFTSKGELIFDLKMKAGSITFN